MKLVIAVVQDQDGGQLNEALIQANLRVTKLASTGGFLKQGNTTFMIGANEDQVEQVLMIIKENCKSRTEFITPMTSIESHIESYTPQPIEIQVGGATVFIVPIEQYHKF
ncbi:cyclic-di-AMP receptor [Hazenella sp. IB182357]|uniref:Cyclic-di-AMP receptor n=1 Tax=Polycladospora coralii TaxID=2771432 RepID=A0A926N975_9BACL|nr:cyclic-di-AMP receptor [Polycladospora coralii]MBD1372486.1 cyclic-di-AMP receptor [Polycladospora coralii]MBS7531808.1 cyclic-di-AMP receptor [Polycladospora coralii]